MLDLFVFQALYEVGYVPGCSPYIRLVSRDLCVGCFKFGFGF